MTRFELRECWAEKLHGFDPSKESFAAFCRGRELNYQNALNWKRKLNVGNSIPMLDFSEVTFPATNGSDFILRRRNWEILVPATFDDQTLHRILAVFEGV